MGKKLDLGDFEHGMVVGFRRAVLSISKTADLLGFSRTTISRVYREIQMVGSELGVKYMKAWIYPDLSQRFRLLVVV